MEINWMKVNLSPVFNICVFCHFYRIFLHISVEILHLSLVSPSTGGLLSTFIQLFKESLVLNVGNPLTS